MTKRDVIALAEVLRIHNQTADARAEFTPDHLQVLANFCAAQYPDFNRERWIDYNICLPPILRRYAPPGILFAFHSDPGAGRILARLLNWPFLSKTFLTRVHLSTVTATCAHAAPTFSGYTRARS